ncbi:MAG: outer membrane protein assembly factor BamB [Verrucomicrobiales bacterium]|jgi:outer membrane protein assembly factor BamB
MKAIQSTLFLIFLTSFASASDWPWRGPNHDGISTETNLKLSWDDEPEIVWKAKIGEGYSSVVIHGNKLFTMGLDNGSKMEFVRCLDAKSGKEIWAHGYKSTFKPKFYDGGTSGTPTVDGDEVYVFGQTGELMSLNASDGKPNWEKNLEEELDFKIGTWGITGAPLVYGDLLILNAGDHGVAVNKATGKVAWSSGEGQNGYATPVLYKEGGSDRVLIFGANGLHSVDPKTGKQSWFHGWKTKYGVNAADPVLIDDKRIFISSGYNEGCAMLELAPGGPKQLWSNKEMRNQLNPSLHLDGYLYGVDGNTSGKATLNCIDAKTGELKWKGPKVGSGSLISAMGKLIIFTEKCELIIATPSPEAFKPSHRAQILGDKCWTTPSLANGLLYVRNQRGDLACVRLK